jgi:hypothetical protein
VAYAVLAEGRDEEQLEELDFAIGMKESPEAEALRALREHQKAMGMVFENPDAPVEPGISAGSWP